MEDRIVQYPHRYKLNPVAGTSDTFDLEAITGTITSEGSLVNKENILPDDVVTEIETAFGIDLGTDPQIKDVFSALTSIDNRVGTIKTTIRTDLGSDWILCNGAEIDSTSYPKLFSENPATAYFKKTLLNVNSISGFSYVNGLYVILGNAVSTNYSCLWYTASLIGTPTWTQVILGTTTTTDYDIIKYLNGWYFVYSSNVSSYTGAYKCSSINGTWSLFHASVSDINYCNGYFVDVVCDANNARLEINYTTNPAGTWTNKILHNVGYVPYSAKIYYDTTDSLFLVAFGTGTVNKTIIFGASTISGTWSIKCTVADTLYYPIDFRRIGSNYILIVSTSDRNGAGTIFAKYSTSITTSTWSSTYIIDGFFNGLFYIGDVCYIHTNTLYSYFHKISYFTVPSGTVTTKQLNKVAESANLNSFGGIFYDGSLWIFLTNGKYYYNSTDLAGNIKYIPTLTATDAYVYIKAL